MFRFASAVLILCGSLVTAAQVPERFDVRSFGAVGDGVADDQPALVRAVKAVVENKGGVLYVPHGVYRCAAQSGAQNGIEFSGVSDVTILFDPGAVLLMDNLNPTNGHGERGHGIVVRGPCRNVTVMNASVKWAKKPTVRSMGDAFRFEGFPDEEKCISNVRLIQCSAENSPQVGAIFMGCSEVDVKNFRVTRTHADGLHFNACRRVKVNGVTGVETGDDTLSFVTYQDDEAVGQYTGGPGSFARADYGEWNSNGSTATNVYAKGGTANGVRLAGAMNVSLSNIVVEGKLRAIVSDCGKKEGNKHSWSWLANRGVTISNVVAVSCTTGFYVANFNQPMSGDDKWWRFDIQLSNLSAKDCKDASLMISNAAGVAVRGVKAEGRRVRLLNARDCTVDGVDLRSGDFVIEGRADGSRVPHDSPTMQELPDLNLIVRDVSIDNGHLDIYDCAGLTCSGVRITHPTGEGMRMNRIARSRLEGISVQ